MKIREMKISDYTPVLYSFWKRVGLDVSSFTEEKKITQQTLELNSNSCFVAEDKGKVIGTVLGTFNGRRGWIYHLAVIPEYQHKGTGSKLMKKAEIALKKRGAPRVLLGIFNSNKETFEFYERLGYVLVKYASWMGKSL